MGKFVYYTDEVDWVTSFNRVLNILWRLTYEYIYKVIATLEQSITSEINFVCTTDNDVQKTCFNHVLKYNMSPYITAPTNHSFSQKQNIFTDTIMKNINSWNSSTKTSIMMNSSKLGIFEIFFNASNWRK